MKQAVVVGPGKIEYREIAAPKAAAGEIVIRPRRIGICGSDLHVFKGEHPLVAFPLVQGHEFSGFVVEVGPGAVGFAPGELVTVQPAIGCGCCARCREGRFAQCDRLQFIGGALEGAGSELFSVRADHAVKLRSGTDPDDAAMVEPLSVAVHAVRLAGDVARRSVLVVGGGTIGNLTAQTARLFGAARVVVAETNPFRRRLAEQLGFETHDPAGESDDAALRGFDVAFECVGNEAPLDLCIDRVRRGGRVVILGVYGRSPAVRMIAVQDKEVQLVGALMYDWDDYATAVGLVEQAGIELKLLRSHHIPFDRWIEGYELLTQSATKTMKVMIDL